MRTILSVLLASSAALTLTAPGLAAEFNGVTLRAKLIGGRQYEALYARVGERETETGAAVEVISKKKHFELDKEFKFDLAAGSLDWCVGSKHSSFAPHYPSLRTDLTSYLAAEFIAEYVPSNVAALKSR